MTDEGHIVTIIIIMQAPIREIYIQNYYLSYTSMFAAPIPITIIITKPVLNVLGKKRFVK